MLIYDPSKHIKRGNLADLIGVKISSLAKELANCQKGVPTRLGYARDVRHNCVVYDKQEAIAWANRRGKNPNDKVPPRSPAPFRPLQLSPGLRQNFERAAEVYPHRLITPTGTGNYREFSDNARRDW